MLGFTVNHTHTGGSSDASHTSALGIPTLDGLGPIGGLDHSPYEYLEASSVAPRIALLAGLVASVGGGELVSEEVEMVQVNSAT
jgi:glutamate carboxypeptidase